MIYQTIYRVDGAIIHNPRWVKNVSGEPVDIMYDSLNYTLQPGEVVYTDLAVAQIMSDNSVIAERDPVTARVLSENRRLVMFDREPKPEVSSADPRVKSKPVEIPIEEQEATPTESRNDMPVTEMHVSTLRKIAREKGFEVTPRSTKQELLAMLGY